MLIVSFSVKGIVHREFVPPNTMANSYFYCDILRYLRENVRWKDRKFGTATTGSFLTTMRLATHPWKPQSLWTATGYHSPSSLLARHSHPVISLCFPNLKRTWRDDVLKPCLTSKGNHNRHSTTLRKMTSTVLFKCGKNNRIAVYIPKETILKEMAAKIE
jgi:hypothetical protein